MIIWLVGLTYSLVLLDWLDPLTQSISLLALLDRPAHLLDWITRLVGVAWLELRGCWLGLIPRGLLTWFGSLNLDRLAYPLVLITWLDPLA